MSEVTSEGQRAGAKTLIKITTKMMKLVQTNKIQKQE